MPRILFVITEDWALFTHRLHLVQDAVDAGYQVGIATKITTLKAEIEALGVDTFDWQISRKSTNIYSEAKMLFRLRKIIKLFQPDLIHAVAIKPVIYSGALLVFSSRIKLVAALGGLGFVFSSSAIKARLLKIGVVFCLRAALLKKGKVLILQNKDDINLLQRLRALSPSKGRLIQGAGVELAMFKFSEVPKGRMKVLLPARILWDKGIKEFLTVAERIKLKRDNVDFVLAGDIDTHNPESATQDEVDSWVESGLIQHESRCPHREMPSVFKKSTIVCLPSYREGFPKALLEGASSGRPLIAFDVEGCRDIVVDGFNGFLVPPKDVDLLEKAILRLVDNRALCMEFGVNGRKLVEREFSSKKINAETFAVWREQLGE